MTRLTPENAAIADRCQPWGTADEYDPPRRGYSVTLFRTITQTQHATVEVNATSPEEARRQADAMDDAGDIEWDTDTAEADGPHLAECKTTELPGLADAP